MSSENAKEFFKKFTIDVLQEREILYPYSDQNLLMGRSVNPLIDLMKESGVDRLENPDSNWFLTAEGLFQNLYSSEEESNIKNLMSLGNVFKKQNRFINPYFVSRKGQNLDENVGPSEKEEEAVEILFGLEHDLQVALRKNIEQLETGLMIVDGGKERVVDDGKGKIDITAQDKEGNTVIIELKAGPAKPVNITQILHYMGAVEEEDKKTVRGIIVAEKFPHKMKVAARAVKNLQLKEYAFNFFFREPEW